MPRAHEFTSAHSITHSEILRFPPWTHELVFQSPFAAQSALKVITTHTNHNWDVFLFFKLLSILRL